MTKGFGPPKPEPKVSQRAKEREAAGQQLDQMKASGALEYEIYLRIQGKPNWVPVGAIAVKRSSAIHQAIYANEAPLLEAAFRMAPMIKKHQDQLEYGYRLKGEKTDPIEVAVKPAPPTLGGLGKAIGGLGGVLGDKLGGLLRRS